MQFWPRQPGNALPGRAATGSGRIFHLAIQPGRQMMTRLPVEYFIAIQPGRSDDAFPCWTYFPRVNGSCVYSTGSPVLPNVFWYATGYLNISVVCRGLGLCL